MSTWHAFAALITKSGSHNLSTTDEHQQKEKEKKEEDKRLLIFAGTLYFSGKR